MANRIRTVNFSMRLREEDDVLLDAIKDKFCMSRSEYLRNLILFAPAKERSCYNSRFAEDLYQRLHAVGNRLNDLAHAVNSRRVVINGDLEETIHHFMELLKIYDEFVRELVDDPF